MHITRYNNHSLANTLLARLGRLELGRKARLHNPNILPILRHLGQLVIVPPVAGRPARPANVNVCVVVQRVQHRADDINTILPVASAYLADGSLTLIAAQILRNSNEARSQIIVAESVLPTLFIKALMQFKDKVRSAAIFVRDTQHRLCTVREINRILPVRGLKEDHLRGRACIADRGHNGLGSGGLGGHVEVVGAFAVVRLVHDAENDAFAFQAE